MLTSLLELCKRVKNQNLLNKTRLFPGVAVVVNMYNLLFIDIHVLMLGIG